VLDGSQGYHTSNPFPLPGWLTFKRPFLAHFIMPIYSRLSDFLISPVDGSYVSGSTLTHYLLAEGPGVNRVKLIQDKKDHIQVIMGGNEQNNRADIQHITQRIKTIFQGSMRVDFEFVESIPLLKFHFLKN
jgi:hypothetical protein